MIADLYKKYNIEFNQSQWLKPYVEFNTQRIETDKNRDKNQKNIVQINEQCCIWQSSEKLQK